MWSKVVNKKPTKKNPWTKQCPCRCYIPDEYDFCDNCLIVILPLEEIPLDGTLNTFEADSVLETLREVMSLDSRKDNRNLIRHNLYLRAVKMNNERDSALDKMMKKSPLIKKRK